MDDAVGGFDVSGYDGGVVDHHGVAADADDDIGASDGGDALAIKGEHGLSRGGQWQDVVGEHRGEQFGVGQQILRGEPQRVQRRREGFLGRREHREGPLTAEHINQTSRLNRGHQSRERPRTNSHFHNRPHSLGLVRGLGLRLAQFLSLRRLRFPGLVHGVCILGVGFGRGWEQDGVYDVDHAVGGLNVGGHHRRVVDHHRAIVDADGHIGAVYGCDALAVEGDHHFRGCGHRQHVIGQHRSEQIGVGQQVLSRYP